MLLEPFEQMGVRALQTASDSINGTAGKVRDAAAAYQAQDDATADAIKTVGPAGA
jgi:hypothetical protein